MVAGMGFEPHDLRVMRASIGLDFKVHRLTKTYAGAPEPTKKPTNVDGKGRRNFGCFGSFPTCLTSLLFQESGYTITLASQNTQQQCDGKRFREAIVFRLILFAVMAIR